MEDARIVELYWQREPQAIAETQGKYGPYCHKIALNILSIPEDAEECVNDTWHKAWTSIPPARPQRLSAWLGRIVRNLSINLWERKHSKKRGLGMDVLLSELGDCVPATGNVEQVLEGKELSDFLSTWLRTLTEADSRLFLRRYWYGDGLKVLAREEGPSEQQLAGRLFRLRKKLRAALEEEGYSL